jgi:hypothetical protein
MAFALMTSFELILPISSRLLLTLEMLTLVATALRLKGSNCFGVLVKNSSFIKVETILWRKRMHQNLQDS